MSRIRFSAGAIAALLVLASCGGGGGQEASGPDALVVTPASATLVVGDIVQVTARFQRDGADLAGGTVTWSSSDEERAIVEPRAGGATILALATGTATITASGDGLTAAIDLTITPPAITDLTVNPPSASLAAGTTAVVRVLATLDNAIAVDVAAQAAWQSALPEIAAVTGNVLTGFAKGETTITATYAGRSATLRVTVLDPVLRMIDVAPENARLLVGRPQQFTATGIFSDGTTRDVTAQAEWISSSAGVAAISNAAGSQGLATGLAAGETTISATAARVIGTTTLTVDAPSLTHDDGAALAPSPEPLAPAP